MSYICRENTREVACMYITYTMKRVIIYIIVALSAITAFGQLPADSVKVYFRLGSGKFDPLLENNAARMDSLVNRIRMAVEAQELDYITIRSYASPDGSIHINERLSKERSKTIADHIISKTGVAPELIRISPESVAWGELRRLVADNPDVPSQARVLDILDNTPIWIFNSKREIVDGRKRQLMSLDSGVPYRWMFNNLFPQLRNALAVSAYLKPDSNRRQPVAEESAPLKPETDNPSTADLSDSTRTVAPDVQRQPVDGEPSETNGIHLPEPEEKTTDSQGFPLALKTNFLYYAALMPNLEVEWLINKHWSVAVDGNIAWWGKYSRQRSYRLAIISSEVRRWIKPRAPWHGMYVGLLAGGGLYDILKDSPGYYGGGVMAGATFGYMWPIGKHLALESGIGAGYLHANIKEYEVYDGHHVYQRTKSLNYFGPLKLKFSLVWHFNKKKQR